MRWISKCIFHSIIFRLHTKTRFPHKLLIIFTTSPSANLWAYPALLGDSKHPGWPPPPHLAVSPNFSGPAQENLTFHYKMQVHHRKINFSNVAGLKIISWVQHEQRKMLFLVDKFSSTCGWTHAKASTTLASPSILAIKVLLTKAYFSPVTWWQTNNILNYQVEEVPGHYQGEDADAEPYLRNYLKTRTDIQAQHHIWVVFPRAGKISKMCHYFFKLFCDQTIWFFSGFLKCSEDILSLGV